MYHPFMSAGTKQIMAMTAAGIFGTMCLVGMLILLNRRLFDKCISKTSKFSDTFILLYLFAQLLLGLLTIPYSAQHLDGSSMVVLANWEQHITTFRNGCC